MPAQYYRRFVWTVGLVLAVPPVGSAQTYSWQGPNNGLWSATANWSGGVVPNAAGVEVVYPAAARTTIDGTFRLGRMSLSGTVFNLTTLTASGGGGLILDNGASAAVITGQPLSNGGYNYALNAPVTVAGNNALHLSAGANLTLGYFATVAIGGVISGSGSAITINPAGEGGRVQLTGANTYGGAGSVTTVAGGILSATDGVGLPTNTNLHLTGGVLEFNSTFNVLNPPAFTRTLGSGVGQVRLSGAAAGFSNSYLFSLPFAVRLNNGTGTVTWGGSFFNPGELILGGNNSQGSVTLENGLDLNGANRTVRVETSRVGQAIQFDYGLGRVAGVISDATGTAGLTKVGRGTLVLTAANTYTGPTVVSDGVMRATDGVGLPTASHLTLAGSNSASPALLELAGSGTFSRTLGTGAGQVRFAGAYSGLAVRDGDLIVRLNNSTGPVTWGGDFAPTAELVLRAELGTIDIQNGLNLAGGTRTVRNDGTFGRAIISGVVTNGSITIAGNTVELTGANTYSNVTYVGGTLRAADGVGLPTASNLYLFSPVSGIGGVFESAGTFTRSLGTGAGQVYLSGGSGFSSAGGTHVIRLNNGTGTLTLGMTNFTPFTLTFGSFTAAGLIDFQNGLDIAGGTLSVNLRDNRQTLADAARLSGVVTNGALTVTGGEFDRSRLELTATNTYSGRTTVTYAVLRAADGVGLPAASNLLVNGGVFESPGPATFTRSVGTGAGQVQFGSNGAGFAATGGTLTVQLNNGTGSLTQPFSTLRLGSTTADAMVDIQNPIVLTGTLVVRPTAAPGYRGPVGRLSGGLSGTGGLSVGNNGFGPTDSLENGAVELTTANTYSGGTSVYGGRLIVNNPSGSGTGTGGVLVTGTAANNGVETAQVLGTLAGSGRVAPAANGFVRVGGNTNTSAFPRIEPGGGADNSLRIETSGTGRTEIGSTFGSRATWAVRVLSAGPGGAATGSGASTVAFPEPTNHTFLDLAGTVLYQTNTTYEIDGTDAGFVAGQRYSYAVGRVDSAANLNGGALLNVTDPTLFSTVGFTATDFSLMSNSSGVIVLTFTPTPEPTAVLAIAAGAGLVVGRRRLVARA